MINTMGNVVAGATTRRSVALNAKRTPLGSLGNSDERGGNGNRSGRARKSRAAGRSRNPGSESLSTDSSSGMNQDKSSDRGGASDKSSEKTSKANEDDDEESPSSSEDGSGVEGVARPPVRMSSMRSRSRSSREDGVEEGDDIQGEETRTVKKLKIQLKEQEKTILELRGLLNQMDRGTTPGSARHARRYMKDCPVDTRMHVHSFALTYFKVVKYLPENYEIYHEKNPICQGVLKGMRGKPANMPECLFYEERIVPCLSSRWTYQRSYIHNKMHDVVKGECYERL